MLPFRGLHAFRISEFLKCSNFHYGIRSGFLWSHEVKCNGFKAFIELFHTVFTTFSASTSYPPESSLPLHSSHREGILEG